VNGTLQTVGGRPTLRFERRLRHPAQKVWKAITDPAELAHWFPMEVEGDFVIGGKLRFPFGADAPTFEGETMPAFEGEVLECDPPRVLAYTWAEDVLRFELIPDDDGCLLVFTSIIGDYSTAARTGAGWHVCLEGLEARLDGTAPPPEDRWKGLYKEYTADFGPEASSAPLPDGYDPT
jgi:uncharacterized protein YndB with AHSA1/START domain